MTTSPRSPFDSVDPRQAWQPWQPTRDDPWSLKWAGHLYRRAAFGANCEELLKAKDAGHAATIRLLLAGADPDAQPVWEKFVADLGEKAALQNDAFQLRIWWLYVILNTPHPLQEKLALLWHNHFATSINKVDRPLLMCRQNNLIRQSALGKFGPFLLAMSRDPAMLFWLDSNSNVKGRPNENYARELMELFSLGVGNYTEKDVREAARAFTGWGVNDDAFDFDLSLHDGGPKTVLSQTGNWGGEDVVRIVLAQPVAARFILRKLFRAFISEASDPPDALLEPLADAFRKSDYDLRQVVETMLSSRIFFSTHAYRQRIKDPVEYVVSAVRAAWSAKAKGSDDAVIEPGMLINHLEGLGQELFAPPNVKGWPGGASWLNTATVLARHNFASRVAAGNLQSSSGPFDTGVAPEVEVSPEETIPQTSGQAVAVMAAAMQGPVPASSALAAIFPASPPPADSPVPEEPRNIAARLRSEQISDPRQIVATIAEIFLDGEIPPDARAKLVTYLTEGKPEEPDFDRRVREVAHAVMTMPEYQLA